MKRFSDEDFLREVPQGNTRAISRLITLVENGSERAPKLQSALYKVTGKAHVIGITGSPGAGKSTLVDGLAISLKKMGQKVAVIAIDPTSPFTGGAILGDRIRMSKIIEDGEIFVRSMATRGALGGISRATLDVVQILDAAGFDTIIIETVGVGQAEVDIVRTADTCVVVMVPGMGDSVQAIKAGILEIADVFAVNKSDRDGADHLIKDLRGLLSLSDFTDTDWKPSIISTVATENKGTEELVNSLRDHKDWLVKTDAGRNRKLRIIEDMIYKLALSICGEKLQLLASEKLNILAKDCLERRKDPYTVAHSLVSEAIR